MEQKQYKENGYVLLRGFFSDSELDEIESVLWTFHEEWLKNNRTAYENGILNSYSITSGNTVTPNQRLSLFAFISQDKIKKLTEALFPAKAFFLNSQLFFDPYNSAQPNYWHRDIQYTGLSISQQQESIQKQTVLHFRIPLKPEPGIELIPGTHQNWDLNEELETRLSLNGRKPSDDLARGVTIPLNRGDLLIFSANMIHRGLYGADRFTFDLIFCDDTPEFRNFTDVANQPNDSEVSLIPNRDLF